MTLVSEVLRYLQQHLARLAGPVVLIALLLSTSCSKPQTSKSSTVRETATPSLFTPRPVINQVDTPSLIRELTPWLDIYKPQLQIRQPRANQTLDDTTVSLVLDIQDLPIYKDEIWDMGPHIELLLDNQPYGSVYDVKNPILLNNLTPGTHTIRAFAVRPWHESFKNEGSYAQVTFHVFAKTEEHSPSADQPLLTYGSPIGTYGAEPVLLDFYLTDAPLHEVAQDSPAISDWQIRYTINGESLILKDWEPIYIEGLKSGQNWVQITLIDDEGKPIEGIFNNTVRLIEYDPSLDNTLAKLVRSQVTLAEVGGIIDPNYEPPVPETTEFIAPEDADQSAAETKPETESISPEASKEEEPEATEPETTEPKTIESETDSIAQPKSETSAGSPIEDSEVQTDVQLFDAVDDESQEIMPKQDPAQTSDELTDLGSPAVEIEPDDASQSMEDIKADLSHSLDAVSETQTDLNPSPELSDAIAPDTEDDSPSDSDNTEASVKEDSPAQSRRYLKRLYDYRQRSMETYGREQ